MRWFDRSLKPQGSARLFDTNASEPGDGLQPYETVAEETAAQTRKKGKIR